MLQPIASELSTITPSLAVITPKQQPKITPALAVMSTKQQHVATPSVAMMTTKQQHVSTSSVAVMTTKQQQVATPSVAVMTTKQQHVSTKQQQSVSKLKSKIVQVIGKIQILEDDMTSLEGINWANTTVVDAYMEVCKVPTS